MRKRRLPVPDVVILVVGYLLMVYSSRIPFFVASQMRTEPQVDRLNLIRDAMMFSGLLLCLFAFLEMVRGAGRTWSERFLGPQTSRTEDLLWATLLAFGAILLAGNFSPAPGVQPKLVMGFVLVLDFASAVGFATRWSLHAFRPDDSREL